MELQRQGSRTSSRSSASALQMRVQEYILNNDSEEWKQQVEYAERRRNKKLFKKEKKRQLMMKRVRLLYVPAFIGIGCGCVILFSAGVQVIGGNTFFWTYQQIFFIVGSIVLVIGVVFLLLAAGVQSHVMEKQKKRNQNAPVICTRKHPDFVKEDLSRQSSWDSSKGSHSNVLLNSSSASENRSLLSPYRYTRNVSLESSFSSTNSGHTPSQTYVHKWAHAASLTVPAPPQTTLPLPKIHCHVERCRTKTVSEYVGIPRGARFSRNNSYESASSGSTLDSTELKDLFDLQGISEENSLEVEV